MIYEVMNRFKVDKNMPEKGYTKFRKNRKFSQNIKI